VPPGTVMSARNNAIGEAEYPKRKRLTPLRNTLGSAAPAPLHCSQGRKASKQLWFGGYQFAHRASGAKRPWLESPREQG